MLITISQLTLLSLCLSVPEVSNVHTDGQPEALLYQGWGGCGFSVSRAGACRLGLGSEEDWPAEHARRC